jgi:outer membrane protein
MVVMRSKWFRRIAFIPIIMIAPMLFSVPSNPLFALMSGNALAQGETEIPERLGVIDMREVIQKSNAMATIRDALDEQNEVFQAAIAEEELQLRQADRELNSTRSILSEEEFNARVSAFEERLISIQRSIQSQKINFDRSIQQAQSQLEQELFRIVSDIAQERSLSMVIQRQNVVIYNNALDITDEALARLNDRTKNITLIRQPSVVQTEN